MPRGKTPVQTLRVVLASPGDVTTERKLADEIVTELNQGLAAALGTRLDLSRWETDSFPGFHVEGAQGLIDPILRIDQCDLLVGIFWKRFGTPTGKADSGTAHEFNTAWTAWKRNGRPQIMVYFNRKPYTPNSVDEVNQWGRVLEFQKKFPKEGLWWPYNGSRQFERLFRNHLTRFFRHWDLNLEQSYLQHAGSNSVPDPVEHESPIGYPLFSSFSSDFETIVKLIVEAEVKRGSSKRPGCCELFAVYRASQKVLDSSRQLVSLLTMPDIPSNLNLLVDCHADLAYSFRNFSAATRECIHQLSIFDETLADSIERILGSKSERVRFWHVTLKEAAEKIKDEKVLAKIEASAINEPMYYRYVGLGEKVPLEGAISLNDPGKLKLAAEDGQMRIAALEHIVAALASVIRARCDFVDLFA